jgi:hypothetical protein
MELRKIVFTDGFKFFEQENGKFTDNENEIDADMVYNSIEKIAELVRDGYLSISSIETYKKI